MVAFGQPLLVAVILWWVSTGAILWLVRRSPRTFGLSLFLYALIATAATAVLFVAARETDATATYMAFGAALTIWGWHEMGFLMGKLTGPRRTPCPVGLSGWSRFRAATETVIHHEIALAATAVLIVGLTWGAPNQIGTLTFLLLLGMRLSTKMNLFLGVANPPITFLPASLDYLQSYFRRRRFNALFPVSLIGSFAVTALLARAAMDAEPASGQAIGYVLLFGLAALGLLEHAFLMTPSPDRALWGWALGARQKSDNDDIALLLASEGETITIRSKGRP